MKKNELIGIVVKNKYCFIIIKKQTFWNSFQRDSWIMTSNWELNFGDKKSKAASSVTTSSQ